MRFSAVIYKDNGEVVSTVQNATAVSMAGKTFIEAVVDGEPEDYYVNGGELREKGERPSNAHFFVKCTQGKPYAHDFSDSWYRPL